MAYCTLLPLTADDGPLEVRVLAQVAQELPVLDEQCDLLVLSARITMLGRRSAGVGMAENEK